MAHPNIAQPAEPVQPLPAPQFDAGSTSATFPALRARRPLFIVGTAVVALAVIGGVSVAVLRVKNVGPFKDSGIAMCEAIRDDKTPKGAGEAPDPAQLEKNALAARVRFADSRYSDLRGAGTRFVDLNRQLQAMDTSSDMSVALAPIAGPKLFDSFTSLSGACVAHGVTIPAMPSIPQS